MSWTYNGVVPNSIYPQFAAAGQTLPDGTVVYRFVDHLQFFDPEAPADNRVPMPVSGWEPAYVAVRGDLVYCFGGQDGTFPTNRVRTYNRATNTWAARADTPPTDLEKMQGALLGGKFYILAYDILYVYDPDANTWQTPATPPSPRQIAPAITAWPGGKIALIAGEVEFGDGGGSRRVQLYDPATNTWSSGPNCLSIRRRGMVSTMVEETGTVYLLGGGPTDTVEIYNAVTGWQIAAGTPPLVAGTANQEALILATTPTTPTTLYVVWHQHYTHQANTAPNAPTLTTMSNGGAINRASVNRAAHAFSDPNPGDSQSAFDLRYRIVGAPTWTYVYAPVPNQFYDFAAGSLAVGDYERQVRTYDAQGIVGPWSASGFFTASNVPAGPTITYPVSGQFVQRDETITWSTAAQAAYQVRRLADAAGAPDTATVYFDTGEVTNPTARSLPLTFATNSRTEHVQVRVKNDGLWSTWATVSVVVSYTPPPAPTMSISADPSTASLLIQMTNPAPVGSQPVASYNNVWVDDGDGEERKATMLPTNSSWRFWTPRSGRDYLTAVRIEVVATNGTTASSA